MASRTGRISIIELFGMGGAIPRNWVRRGACYSAGFGLCLWRLGRFEEAAGIFDRMLWLNPIR